MHLIGKHLPGGLTISACGEMVLLGRFVWALSDVTCAECLATPLFNQMDTSRRH